MKHRICISGPMAVFVISGGLAVVVISGGLWLIAGSSPKFADFDEALATLQSDHELGLATDAPQYCATLFSCNDLDAGIEQLQRRLKESGVTSPVFLKVKLEVLVWLRRESVMEKGQERGLSLRDLIIIVAFLCLFPTFKES